METSNIIEVTHLNKQFLVDKQPMEVLHDISLQVKQGEFITIVGHSGCGKSTLLKIICGLVGYEDGQVERNGHPVTGPGPKCGMVFQDHRLLPWLKIKDNVGFGLGDLPKQERDEKVRKHLELVGLAGFENSYPSQLSGGMSQRAAIARGLANNPTILLLDEPFGALDALTRIQMQKESPRFLSKHPTHQTVHPEAGSSDCSPVLWQLRHAVTYRRTTDSDNCFQIPPALQVRDVFLLFHPFPALADPQARILHYLLSSTTEAAGDPETPCRILVRDR